MLRGFWKYIIIGLALGGMLSEALLACPNCFGSSNKSVIDAFITSYYLLSGIPLGIIAVGGGTLYYLNRKFSLGGNPATHAKHR